MFNLAEHPLVALVLILVLCIAAAAIRKQQQPKRKPRKRRELAHGSRGRYTRDGCRCEVCVAGHEARKLHRKQLRQNKAQPQ